MDNRNNQSSRRRFIYNLGLTAFSLPLASALSGHSFLSEETAMEHIKQQKAAGKLGIALVGLGGYAGGQLAPALQQTEHCFLAAIVTGTPSKAETWKKKYNIPASHVYSYQNFDQIKNNPDIDIVYVVLPNSMHAEYTIRAAKAGKHVICEKPMAITVEDCNKMIAACRDAGKQLSIGYRLHFEPYNKEMVRLGTQKVFGPVRKMHADFGIIAGPGWRLDKELAGGGPLVDVGIYCIQGVCYTTGLLPVAVTAVEGPKKDAAKFKTVEESMSWQMEMSDGTIAECWCSYSDNKCRLRAEAQKGWFELDPAFYYSGLAGSTSQGRMNFPQIVQQAKQMDDFALAIKDNRPSPVPGEMGKRDVRYINAIYKAMETGKRVVI